MSKYIPYFEPKIGEEEVEEVADCLDSGWLTTGPKVEELEERFSNYVGADHAVAVNSCTAALHLALDVIGLGEEDEVITTPYTFSSTAEVVQAFGAKPVFADIKPRCFNIDPNKVKSKISDKTKAIIAVHMSGFPCDMRSLKKISNQEDIYLIEDAAHAFPAKYNGKHVGSISDITCFSFYANKTITTGEGGMLTTDKKEVARECRMKSLHGIDKNSSPNGVKNENWSYDIKMLGYKYNMPDICAAIGLRQMDKKENMKQKRKKIAKVYNKNLPKEKIEIPINKKDINNANYTSYNKKTSSSNHLYMIRLKLDKMHMDRSEFMRKLEKYGVGTSVHYIPLHIQTLYKEKFNLNKHSYPIAYNQFEREVSIPISNKMDVEDAYKVTERIKKVLK